MRNRNTFIVIMALVLGGMMGAWKTPSRTLADQQPAADDSISDRLAALEKAIVRNPERPRETVLARLEAIEDLLRKQGQANDKQTDAAKKTVDEAAVEQEKLERRMKILENKAQEGARNNINEMNDMLRDLKKDLSGFQQSIKDLSDRVRKLEQRI